MDQGFNNTFVVGLYLSDLSLVIHRFVVKVTINVMSIERNLLEGVQAPIVDYPLSAESLALHCETESVKKQRQRALEVRDLHLKHVVVDIDLDKVSEEDSGND